MKIRLLHYAVYLVGGLILWGTMNLVWNQYSNGDICPPIFGIPACYIILACILAAIISHTCILKDKHLLFSLGSGVAILFATVGSVGNLFEVLACPKTSSGIPMCYISFAMFGSLILVKILEIKISSGEKQK